MPKDLFAGTHIGPDGRRVRDDGEKQDDPAITEAIAAIKRATARIVGTRAKDNG